MQNCCRISEDEEKTESALILNCLEEGTQLCVLIDLVLECQAFAISWENCKLFVVPIIEKLEKLNEFLAHILKLWLLKSKNGMISCQAICNAPNRIHIPQVTSLDLLHILIQNIFPEFINNFINCFEISRLPNYIMYCYNQTQICKRGHAKFI